MLGGFALAEGEQQFADLGQCKVESGETIQNCRIGYRTWGKLNAEQSNIVVLLTWFTGTSEQQAGSVGADKYVDPAHYYVVAIDALANGVSSSPSNSKAQPRMKFPQITIADMVESQHRLLTETLKLKHIRAVLGGSMGGMQAFQWAVQYPDYMDAVISIVGTTQMTAHDLLLWRAEKNAILENKNFNDGDYKAGLLIPSVADIHHLELTTPDRINDDTLPKNFPTAAEKIEASETMDPCDRLRQLDAMMTHDISMRFNGQMSGAAKAVKAHMLIIVSNSDHMVNPHPAMVFAELLLNVPMQLDSTCGHLAPGCREEQVVPAVHRALELKSFLQ